MVKSKKKIGIVGFGYVGKAMHQFFKNHYEVLVNDIGPAPQNGVSFVSIDQINSCELAVVCVPTPPKKDGSCDTSHVKDVVGRLNTPLILLKSTIPVGTTDSLIRETGKRIVFSPEYCGESSYWTPYKFHTEIKETPFFTFGGNKEDTSKMIDYFLPVTGPVKTYRQTTAVAAEMAKYMENVFYATKITFCYEFANICRSTGVDFNEVRELWLLDPRINPMHTAVFHENDRPFSGKCLPKDLAATIELSRNSGYEPELLKEVAKSNERIEKIRKEWRNTSIEQNNLKSSITGFKKAS